MADVQIDKGEYTRIANALLEQSSKLHLNGTQYAIILTIWRFTYGFNRCEHDLSITFISKATGISTRAIKKELKSLIDRNIVLVTKECTKADSRVLKFNKDYDTWEHIERGTTDHQGNNRSPGEQSIPCEGNKTTPEEGNKTTPKKDIKTTLKTTAVIIMNSDENAFISILESVENYPSDRTKDLAMYKSLQEAFPTVSTLEAIKDWAVYKTDHPIKKDSSPRSQINNSFKNCIKWNKNLKQREKPKGRLGVTEGESAGIRRDDM